MKRLLGCTGALLVLSSAAWAQQQQVTPFDPGSASSTPGSGCDIGTSGCFPTAPPGPQTPPTDPGATYTDPPPVVDPQNVPLYGTLPGPAGKLERPVLRGDVAAQVREQEQRAYQQRQIELLDQQTAELQQQREELRAQTEELAAQREQLQLLADQLQQGAQKQGDQSAPGEPQGAVAPQPPSTSEPPTRTP